MKKMMLAMMMLGVLAPAWALTVGKVDLQKAVLQTKQGKNIRDKLKKEFEKKKKILTDMEEKIKKAQQDFAKKDAVLSDKAKAKERNKIQQDMLEYQQQAREFQKEMQAMEKSYTDPILKNMKPIVDKVSKSAKVDLTFETSASPLLYAEKEVDLTEQIVSEYDKKHSKKQ